MARRVSCRAEGRTELVRHVVVAARHARVGTLDACETYALSRRFLMTGRWFVGTGHGDARGGAAHTDVSVRRAAAARYAMPLVILGEPQALRPHKGLSCFSRGASAQCRTSHHSWPRCRFAQGAPPVRGAFPGAPRPEHERGGRLAGARRLPPARRHQRRCERASARLAAQTRCRLAPHWAVKRQDHETGFSMG